MYISAWRFVFALVVAGAYSTTSLSLVAAQNPTTNDNCIWSEPFDLDAEGGVTLEHYINHEKGTISFRITYDQAHSWIGWGFNLLPNNENNSAATTHTTPTYAVIGQSLGGFMDHASYVGEAYRFFINNTAVDGSGISQLQDAPGHLKSSVFTQSPVLSDYRISTLEFTHDVLIRNENNLDEILYRIRVPSPEVSNVAMGSNTTTATNSAKTDDQSVGEDLVTNLDYRLRRRQRRRSLQTSSFTSTTTTTRFIWAVGLPDNEWPSIHNRQGSFTFEDLPTWRFCSSTSSNSNTDGPSEAPTTQSQSIGNNVFPTPMNNPAGEEEETNLPIIDFGDNDEFSQDDDQVSVGKELQDPVAHLWMYHGILMGVAWGVFAPLAIFIPLLRKLHCLEYDGRWKSIHFLSSLLTVVLSVTGFALAVMAANPWYSISGQEMEQQYFTGNMHVALGVMILVIMIVQAVMGCCIPSDKKKNDVASDWNAGFDLEAEEEDDKSGIYDDDKTKKSSKSASPLRTMMIDNNVVNPDGQLVPNRTAYKQYLPKRFAPPIQDRAQKRIEATTILGSATGDNNGEHQVASLTPRKTEAKSHHLEAIEVVDVADLKFISIMHENNDRNDAMVPTTLTPRDGDYDDEVSELEEPTEPTTHDEHYEKSDLLICWIYTHRLMGLALFAMALYTCHTGIVLQSESAFTSQNGDETSTYWTKELCLVFFWSVTGGIICFILLIRVTYPCFQTADQNQRDNKNHDDRIGAKQCQSQSSYKNIMIAETFQTSKTAEFSQGIVSRLPSISQQNQK